MVNVVLAIHLIIAVAMIALILMQKSEGNSAGGGFSVSSVSAMMQPRARPNALSRATTILGISFFVTSLGLALIAKNGTPTQSVILGGPAKPGDVPKVSDILPTEGGAPAVPAAPSESAPATTPPAAPPAAPTVPQN